MGEQKLSNNGLNSKGAPRLIRFVSLNSMAGIEDLETIKEFLAEKNYDLDFYEFKVKSTRIQRRSLSAERRGGPKHRVEIEEKIDVNSNYRYLRQLAWRVQKEVNNVLLIKMNQIKAVPCSLPLIFPSVLKAHQKILVTGITAEVKSQLTARPDLHFREIPDQIQKNSHLKNKILERADRAKAMQAIAREMQDFIGIPEVVKSRLEAIALGEKVFLSDVEAINIILISDLYSRYLPLFQSFQSDIVSRTSTVSALASQFADMTRAIRTEKLIEVFRDYLIDESIGDEALASQNNAHLFNYLYQKAQLLDEKRVKLGDHPLSKAEMFAMMRSLITLARSQVDPDLWNQCLFFFKHDDIKSSFSKNRRTVLSLADGIYTKLIAHHSASTQSLLEIHLIHNIHRLISGRKVLINKTDIAEIETSFIRSVIVPFIYQTNNNLKKDKSVRLFLGMNDGLSKLINPIHTVSRVYSFLIGRRLREGVQRFLKPGLKDLLERFGKNFFSIFYEMVVLESSLPLTRNNFAKWLEYKGYFKQLEQYGFIPSNLEDNYDPLLLPKKLLESGESYFPGSYTADDFAEDFEKSRDAFFDCLEHFKTDKKGFGQVLYSFVQTGEYNLKTSVFREYIKRSQYYKTLKEIVMQACVEIQYRLTQVAVNNKIVISIPLEFESLLLIENIFDISVEHQVIQVHLITVPVKSPSELDSISEGFSKTFLRLVQSHSEFGAKELTRINRILNVYLNVYFDFFKYLSIVVLDRQINGTILKIRQQKNQTPNHIKYFFKNEEKLIITNDKNVNLGRLVQVLPTKKQKQTHYQLSVSQAFQTVIFFKNANHKLRDYRTTISRIKALIERSSGEVKSDLDAQTYFRQISKFQEMLSTPVNEISENILNLITTLAKKIEKTEKQSQAKKGALTKLYHLWKEQNPSQKDKIKFYAPFLREEDTGYEQKLFLEIAKTRDLLISIEQKKCAIFFPDKQQEEELSIISEIGSFFKERELDIKMYVEVSSLTKEQIESLAKVFYPGNFFTLDNLKPIKQPTH